MIHRILRISLGASLVLAASAEVSVSTTSTQAILVYTAPATDACSVAVSESASLSPLVPDVDPAIFAGANLDSRPGTLASGTQRIFVAGKHGMNASASPNSFLGADGKRHSRALQAGTTHYYKITCGTTVMMGSFATAPIVSGGTYPEILPVDATHPGGYNWPDLNPNDRKESVIDPVTGALVRRVTTQSDTDPNSGIWPDSGAFSVCSHVPVVSAGVPYFVCAMPSAYAATLVSVNTATGDVQPLTSLIVPYLTFGNQARISCGEAVFDSTDGTAFYCLSGSSVIAGKWTGALTTAGTFSQDAPDAALRWTLLTPAPSDLNALLRAFDPAFTAAQQQALPYWLPVSVQQGKIVLKLWGGQNYSGWVVVFSAGNGQPLGSGGTGGVVAALPVWKAPASRWCGIHNILPAGDGSAWAMAVPNDMTGGGTFGGPYRLMVSGPAGGAIGPADTLFTIQSQGGSYEPAMPGPAYGYLMDAQPGDLFFLDNNGDGSFTYGVDEYIELVSKNAATHQWTVRRASQMASSPFYANTGLTLWQQPASSAPAGAPLYAACRTNSMADEASPTLWWNFNLDPHGNSVVLPAASGATSPEVIEHTHTGGHSVARNEQNAMVDWGCFGGSLGCWTGWTQTGGAPGLSTTNPPLHSNAAPTFNGSSPSTNSYQMHPSHEQMTAGAAAQTWILDRMPFVFGTNSAQLVAGTSSIYRVAVTTLQRDSVPTQATCGINLLRDVSSPATGTQIGDSMPYTYCVARKGGECLSNSSAGDIFVSCPGANYRYSGDPSTTVRCFGNVLSSTATVDICVGDAVAYGQSVVQGGYSQSLPNGELNRVITQGFSHYHEPNSLYDTAFSTPDGTWAMFSSTVTGHTQAYMAKLPEQPAADPTTRRDNYIPVSVNLHPSVSGVNNAVVQFGYLENGSATDYFCTSRREVCLAGAGTAAFAWATDGAAGQPCASGCSIQIPVIPGRVAYFQAVYRNSANSAIATGETGIASENGTSVLGTVQIVQSGAATAVTLTPANSTLSAGKSVTLQFADSTGPVAAKWSVAPSVGTITNGVYTAPLTIAANQAVTVTAVDTNNAARSASATVNLTASGISQQSTTLSLPIRVNAGGGAYSDPAGRMWLADTGSSGGSLWSVSAKAGLDVEYQTVRYGSSFNYTFHVPNGTYTVVLKFAEVLYTTAGRRQFNAAINGSAVLTNFDIAAAAGGLLIPIDKAFPVTVANGQIQIAFSSGTADSPAINAIEILPFTAGASATSVRAGDTLRFTASTPVTWSVSGAGTITSSGLYTAPGTVTSPVPLVTVTARSMADATQTIAIPVTLLPLLPVTLTPGSTTLAARQSVSFVFADSTGPVAAKWSLSPAVGTISNGVYTAPSSIASSQAVTVTAVDSNNAARSATATINLTSAITTLVIAPVTSIRVNAGGGAYTDPAGRAWSADTGFTGGSTWAVGPKTGLDAEYQTVRYSHNFSYNFAVANGAYTVKLKFAEVALASPGQRRFNVAINGTPVLADFDILVAAGGFLVPVDKTFPVAVTNGQIQIVFSAGMADAPAVNAIEILPSTAGTSASSPTAGGL